MSEFPINSTRHDPYKGFTFRVAWGGKYIPGICRVSGLTRTTEVVEHREGGDLNSPRFSLGKTAYAPIVLERGRTHDDEFEQWANKVSRFGAQFGAEVSLKDFRKDIALELYNEAGQKVMAWKIYRCWPSEYKPINDLDGNGQATVVIESMTLQCEGWERDTDVGEPMEPSFNG